MKYQAILADPPWTYQVWSKKGQGRSAEHHYPTMTKEEIQNMDVNSIADTDCALFLWVTIPCIQEGFELINKWGFIYKTFAFIWLKKNKKSNSNFWGMGHWTRSNAEIVILATKGNPKRVDKGIHQIVETFDEFETETLTHEIGRHSEKPHEVRKKIEKLCGDVPRVELFARERHSGWHAFGNEIEDSIEIPNAIIQPFHYENIQQRLL